MSNKLKGNLLMLITAMAWGSGFAARKLGTEGFPPIAFNGLRMLGAALVLLPMAMIGLKKSGYLSREGQSYKKYKFHVYRVVAGGVACGLFLTLASTMQTIGLETASAGKSGFITSLYVVITPLFARVFGKKIKKKTWACIVVAMIGFALLSLNEGLGSVHACDIELLIGAAGFAAHIITVNKFVDKGNDIILTVVQLGLCGILELIYAIPAEQPTLTQFVGCVPALLYSVIVSGAIGYGLQIVGQKYTDSTSSALILGLESVFSAVFGAIVLGEMMAFRELLGCLLIFASVIYNQVDIADLKRRKAA